MGDFTIDAVLGRSFTIDAWLLGSTTWQHDRLTDHRGVDSDLYVVLSTDIGRYPTFTPIHFVLEDMVSRLERLEAGPDIVRGAFVIDAWLAESGTWGAGIINMDAVIFATSEGGFDIDAWFAMGGSFTIDASFACTFTLNAMIA